MPPAYMLAFDYLVPGAQWSCDGDGSAYEQFTWLDARPKPTQQQCDAVIDSAIARWQTNMQRARREAAYRTEADPLFFKAQRNEDGVTLADWEAKVAEIRERYPYPA